MPYLPLHPCPDIPPASVPPLWTGQEAGEAETALTDEEEMVTGAGTLPTLCLIPRGETDLKRHDLAQWPDHAREWEGERGCLENIASALKVPYQGQASRDLPAVDEHLPQTDQEPALLYVNIICCLALREHPNNNAAFA